MKVAYFYPDTWEKEYIEKRLPGADITFYAGIINDYMSFDEDIQAICVFVDSRVDAALLQKLPNLKLIVTRSTGTNHIDMSAAHARGITVCDVPAYGTYAVAEFTFALMLALSRNIRQACARTCSGNFTWPGLTGFDLRGKTLGVVGAGCIGRQVAALANCFGMKVLAHDVHVDQALAHKIGFTYVPLEQLFAQADIVSLHVTYCEQTHHMINVKNIDTFKRGAYLINTSRGAVVETEALVYGLTSGILAGIGLDVLEEEWALAHLTQILFDKKRTADELRRMVAVQYLLNHPRVLITPHTAFNSFQAREQCLAVVIEAINNA